MKLFYIAFMLVALWVRFCLKSLREKKNTLIYIHVYYNAHLYTFYYAL